MGFAAVAGHVVILVAMFSAGALFAGAMNDSLSSQMEAREKLAERIEAASRAEYSLASEGYSSGTDRTYANFTNDGAGEVNLDDLTILVDGTVTSETDVQRFRVREDTSSRIWMPGETLEVMLENRGNADVTIVDGNGVAAHRRS